MRGILPGGHAGGVASWRWRRDRPGGRKRTGCHRGRVAAAHGGNVALVHSHRSRCGIGREHSAMQSRPTKSKCPRWTPSAASGNGTTSGEYTNRRRERKGYFGIPEVAGCRRLPRARKHLPRRAPRRRAGVARLMTSAIVPRGLAGSALSTASGSHSRNRLGVPIRPLKDGLAQSCAVTARAFGAQPGRQGGAGPCRAAANRR